MSPTLVVSQAFLCCTVHTRDKAEQERGGIPVHEVADECEQFRLGHLTTVLLGGRSEIVSYEVSEKAGGMCARPSCLSG